MEGIVLLETNIKKKKKSNDTNIIVLLNKLY